MGKRANNGNIGNSDNSPEGKKFGRLHVPINGNKNEKHRNIENRAKKNTILETLESLKNYGYDKNGP